MFLLPVWRQWHPSRPVHHENLTNKPYLAFYTIIQGYCSVKSSSMLLSAFVFVSPQWMSNCQDTSDSKLHNISTKHTKYLHFFQLLVNIFFSNLQKTQQLIIVSCFCIRFSNIASFVLEFFWLYFILLKKKRFVKCLLPSPKLFSLFSVNHYICSWSSWVLSSCFGQREHIRPWLITFVGQICCWSWWVIIVLPHFLSFMCVVVHF